MTKLERLNSFLSERLTAALNEIIYTVSMTMKEYEEETARIRKENEHLKEMLKVTACSVTEANPDVTVFSLPSGQEDCNSSLEQKLEPQESQNEHWQQKEANSCIKTEQPSYPVTQPDCTVVPLQCTSPLNTQAVDQEMMHYELTGIKIESADTDSYSETTDDMDRMESTDSTDSTEQWDRIFSEKTNQSGVHQVSSRWPRAVKGVHFTESASQNRPMEFRPVSSISNQILCNNKQHCTSRQCEMHKTIPKSSPAWRYFSLKEGDCSKAVCLICKAVISRGIKEYTTSALLRHLRGKHGYSKC